MVKLYPVLFWQFYFPLPLFVCFYALFAAQLCSITYFPVCSEPVFPLTFGHFLLLKLAKMMRTQTQDTQWQAGLEQKETKQKEAVVQNSNPNYKQQN